MSGIKGHPSQKRIKPIVESTNTPISTEYFASIVPTDINRAAMDMLPKALYPVNLLPLVAETIDPALYLKTKNPKLRIVKFTGNTARKGDILRFVDGLNNRLEVSVEAVDGADMYLSGELIADPDTNSFLHMRYITLTISEDGQLQTTAGPVQYLRDGLIEEVEEDTVVPANNRALPSGMFINKDGVSLPINKDTATPANTTALPVEIVSATGSTVTITAGDINIHSTHLGATFDSMRIGDGTNLIGVTALGEAQVLDAQGLVELKAILAKIIAAPATEAKQDAEIVELQAILAKIIAAPATEAKQDVVITELQALQAANSREIDSATRSASEDLKAVVYTAIGPVLTNTVVYKEIELSYQDGATIEIFDGDGGASLGMVTQAGGKIPVNVTGDGAKQIHLRVPGGDVTISEIMLNLIK